MATQEQLQAALDWARTKHGMPYQWGGGGDPSWDCSGFIASIQKVIQGKNPIGRLYSTFDFDGDRAPAGWERNLQAPFMIGITNANEGHTAGTLLGVNVESSGGGRGVRVGPTARGYNDPMFTAVYGYRPSLLEGPPVPTEDVKYVVKAGDTLASIASANGTTVTELVNLNPQLVQVGMELLVKKGVPVPTVPQFPGTVKLASVGPGGDVAMNKIVQSCLNYLYPPVVIDGIYGNQTKAAYTKWQIACGFNVADGSADGLPGLQSMTKLAAKFGFTLDTTAPPAPEVGVEPAHNYTRRTWSGKTVNQRTYDMLKQAEALSGQTITLSQGSYNTGVSASAGTHDGGGVVDIASSNSALCQALRKVGFAAWIRTPAQGFAYHIHACAIGDREMASGAKNQVQSYFDGRNGLAGNGADTNPPRPWPAWANKYNN